MTVGRHMRIRIELFLCSEDTCLKPMRTKNEEEEGSERESENESECGSEREENDRAARVV